MTVFRRAMVDAGLICDALPIADGPIHRFHVEGDRRGSRNGWYILFPDDPPAGAFGSWENGDGGHHAVSRHDGLFFVDFGQLLFDGFVMVSGEAQLLKKVIAIKC